MNKDLPFNPGVNILIGVNGSGKTSILNAMAWTLSPASIQDGVPAAYLLSSLEFDEICITYIETGQEIERRVTAIKSENSLTIQIDNIKEVLDIPIVERPELTRQTRIHAVDEPIELVSRFIEDQWNNPVLRLLSDLPGPLYLPLNRRWTEDREPIHRMHRRRSTTAGHLPISQVLNLAEQVLRQEQVRIFALNDDLRNKILASLFETDALGLHSRVWTLEELRQRRQRVITTFGNLGLAEAKDVGEKYFSKLESVVNDLEGQTVPPDFSTSAESQKWVEWIIEGAPIAFRMEKLLPLIESYEDQRACATRRSSRFLDSVNSFIRDNGKELEVSSELDLFVKQPNGYRISGHHLSSGELQLLILFTFLYFRFDPEQEFAVFVDEPELSLHLAWQHRYVNSIREANPHAQFIIATHSPEIVGPAEDAIINISPEGGIHAQV